jgi:hypothetical protein
MKHTFHNILLISCTFRPPVPSFYNSFNFLFVTLLSAKVVFAIRLARTLLNVNNHIKGAVMIETIFIGMATAFALLRDDSTLFALAIILLTPERKVNITTTTPTAMVGAYGFKLQMNLQKLHIGCNLIPL